jgi:hypothetical protein
MPRAVELISPDGVKVTAYEESLPNLVAQGYRLADGAAVETDTEYGRLTNRGDLATDAVAKGGDIVTESRRAKERFEAEQAAKYDTFGGEILSGVQSFGNALTGGLAERASRAIVSPDDPDFDPMAQYRKHGRTGALVGEVAAFLMPTPLGKAGLAAKGAKGVATRLAATTAESALQSAASAAANATLDNRELTAEGLLADTASGALFGVGAGAVSEIATAVGARYLARKAASEAADAKGAIKVDYGSAATHADDVIRRGASHSDPGIQALAAEAKAAHEALDAIVPGLRKTEAVGGDIVAHGEDLVTSYRQLEQFTMDNMAALKSTREGADAYNAAYKMKDRIKGTLFRKGKTVADLSQSQKKMLVGVVEKYGAALRKAAAATPDLSHLAGHVDELATAARSSASKIYHGVDAGTVAKAADVDIVDAIGKLGPIEQKAALEAVAKSQRTTNQLGDALGVARPTVNNLDDGASALDYAAIAEAMGLSDFVPDDPTTNALLFAIVTRGKSRGHQGGRGALSSVADGLDGIPAIGGLAAAPIKAAQRALGSAREAIGSAGTAFVRAHKATKQFHAKAATAVFNNVRFFDMDHEGPVAPRSAEAAFKRRADELAAAVANPDRVRAEAISKVVDLAEYAPDIASSYVEGQLARNQFLYDRMPKPPADYPLDWYDWAPSKLEQASWARYVDAATNPYGALRDIEKGTVTPEAAETLRTVYPALFTEFQTMIADNAEAIRKKLPRDRRNQLAIVMGVPLDGTHDPGFVARMQSDYAPPTEQQGGPVTQNDRAMKHVTSEQPSAAQQRMR